MWSAVCMIFEMLTGELLFNPRKDENNTFGKNDDHLAQIMELIGRFPKKFALSGTKARKYFSREGRLRRIPKFQNWGIKDVVIAKYRFQEKVAEEFENFMLPMLASLPNERVQAREMLKHPWLYTPCPENYFMYVGCYQGIKTSMRSYARSGMT